MILALKLACSMLGQQMPLAGSTPSAPTKAMSGVIASRKRSATAPTMPWLTGRSRPPTTMSSTQVESCSSSRAFMPAVTTVRCSRSRSAAASCPTVVPASSITTESSVT